MLNKAFGVGLRPLHFSYFQKHTNKVDILEVHPENFFGESESNTVLDDISHNYPISFHGVGLSLGSAEKVSKKHLKKIKTLIERYKPISYSEHMSWIKFGATYFHDLLPMEYNDKTLETFVSNIKETQDYLGMKILIENPSSYVKFIGTIEEYDFINLSCEKSGAGLLLDVNNLYVNSYNFGFNFMNYIDMLEIDLVEEVHLAGHKKKEDIIIDTHDSFVSDSVWDIYKYLLKKSKNYNFFTIVEWDANFPDPSKLCKEAVKAKNLMEQNERSL